MCAQLLGFSVIGAVGVHQGDVSTLLFDFSGKILRINCYYSLFMLSDFKDAYIFEGCRPI